MRTIYIGVSKPAKWRIGAELIKLYLKEDYSHAYIRLKQEGLGMSSIYQASRGMVHFREFEKFKQDNIVVKEFELEIDDSVYKEILKECFNQAGEKYDYLDLLKILYFEVTGNQQLDSRGYICSELVAKICIEYLNISFDKPKHLLNPKDVCNKLESLWPNLKIAKNQD